MILALLFACHQDTNPPPPKESEGQTTGITDADGDGDGVQASSDCDDNNADIYPGALEVCDGLDNNCNGTVDEGLTRSYYQDSDADGYGDDLASTTDCTAPIGYIEQAGDCNDADATIHPDATELCTDTVDRNCDGTISFEDADSDGSPACEDCDDTNGAVFPAATEVCNGLDDNCDTLADEADPSLDLSTTITVYTDIDGDGYGDDATATQACTGAITTGGDCNDNDVAYYPGAPETDCTDPNDYNCDGSSGYADSDGDGYVACQECNDAEAAVNPGVAEICNAIDDNCDGQIDEGVTTVWYADADGDTFGDPGSSLTACSAPTGYVTDAQDCNDADGTIHPGVTELCDGADNDCNGLVDDGATDAIPYYADGDGDGYGDGAVTLLLCTAQPGWVSDRTDCDDGNAAVNPGAGEQCDGLDNDCDGSVDVGAVDARTWYQDQDGDAYGTSNSVVSCDQPSGYAAYDGDCDDADPAFHPNAAEPDCNDPNDYNCDGSTGFSDTDGDGYPACTDCNDLDALVNPSAAESCNGYDDDCNGAIDEAGALGESIWYADGDADGYGDSALSLSACDAPIGYVVDNTDCDDSNASTFPGAAERCNGVDDDCDGQVDVGAIDPATWYYDGDQDTYGDSSLTQISCDQPSGYVPVGGDCNDTDTAYHPGAPETDCADPNDYNCDGFTGANDGDGDGYPACLDCNDADANINTGATEACNGYDDNCDGVIDESGATGEVIWYADGDGDAYGDARSTTLACSAPPGYVGDATDCDDSFASINPGSREICDGLDNDCDGTVDLGAVDAGTWYSDQDSDGYGDPAASIQDCTQPVGTVADASDCDDSNTAIHPGAQEICDSIDNDCDGIVDNNPLDPTSWYTDADGDGYGQGAITYACSAPPGTAIRDGDCNDGDASVYPNAPESCTATVDNNCDGSIGANDADKDGYRSCEECNDGNPAINPGATEVCNGYDDNCDSQIDEAGAVGETIWYQDSDGDGYGGATSISACNQPTGYTATSTDCDDSRSTVNPGGVEACNGYDDDCDNLIDEAGAVGETTWYYDGDGDGYGATSPTVLACNQPSGYVANALDCNDGSGIVNPNAADICDRVDNDCDGQIDEGGYCACPVVTYNGHPYQFCTNARNWNDSAVGCRADGYDLVTINDATENTWVVSTALATSNGRWWAGGTDAVIDGTWEWVSKQAWTYSNFHAGSGYANSKDCLQIGVYSDYSWEDGSCRSSAAYVCEGQP